MPIRWQLSSADQFLDLVGGKNAVVCLFQKLPVTLIKVTRFDRGECVRIVLSCGRRGSFLFDGDAMKS